MLLVVDHGSVERDVVLWDVLVLVILGVKEPSCEAVGTPGCSGAALKRLLMPLTTSPGCIPKYGVSKLIVPNIRWRKGVSVTDDDLGGSRATSTSRIPPIL